jgi:hypothetical protein
MFKKKLVENDTTRDMPIKAHVCLGDKNRVHIIIFMG